MPMSKRYVRKLFNSETQEKFTRINEGFPGSLAGKESAYNAGDLGLIPELGRSPVEGKGYSFQYSGLENSMDSIVRGCQRVRHD